jgi:hypothetical protein
MHAFSPFCLNVLLLFFVRAGARTHARTNLPTFSSHTHTHQPQVCVCVCACVRGGACVLAHVCRVHKNTSDTPTRAHTFSLSHSLTHLCRVHNTLSLPARNRFCAPGSSFEVFRMVTWGLNATSSIATPGSLCLFIYFLVFKMVTWGLNATPSIATTALDRV